MRGCMEGLRCVDSGFEVGGWIERVMGVGGDARSRDASGSGSWGARGGRGGE